MKEKKHTYWHETIKKEEESKTSWKPKGKVWFQKNDDSKLGEKGDFESTEEASENISNLLARQRQKERPFKLKRDEWN